MSYCFLYVCYRKFQCGLFLSIIISSNNFPICAFERPKDTNIQRLKMKRIAKTDNPMLFAKGIKFCSQMTTMTVNKQPLCTN